MNATEESRGRILTNAPWDIFGQREPRLCLIHSIHNEYIYVKIQSSKHIICVPGCFTEELNGAFFGVTHPLTLSQSWVLHMFTLSGAELLCLEWPEGEAFRSKQYLTGKSAPPSSKKQEKQLMLHLCWDAKPSVTSQSGWILEISNLPCTHGHCQRANSGIPS